MAENRGKKFEEVIKQAFQKVPGVSIDRLHDQTTGFAGSTNICDFIVYREPNEFYFECKSVHGNTLPFSNITEKQWLGLLEKSKIEGVFAGVICWWVDRDITKYIPIQVLQFLKSCGDKSISFRDDYSTGVPAERPFKFKNISSTITISGKKKRVFFDYDMEGFLDELSTNRD